MSGCIRACNWGLIMNQSKKNRITIISYKNIKCSVVWPQQPLYCSGMPEHLVCYNNYLKACHIASHKEEIYNSLHHYTSIPQNIRSTRTNHNTSKEVRGHHTTYNYVWWMWPITGHVSTTSSFLIKLDQDFVLTTCHPVNASTSYSPIRCRSDSSASWKSTICRTDLDIQTLMSKVSTIGWRKYSFMAAWRRLLRSTPWKHCWYLPSNRTLSYNSYFILIKIHIIVVSVFPVSLGDNVDILSWKQTYWNLKQEKNAQEKT